MNLANRFVYDIKSRRPAHFIAIGIAISLPWSTSAALVSIIVWLLALLPTIDLSALRREIFTPAGGIPLLLVAWAALGMFWGHTSWAESFEGLRQFHKLLFIPIFLSYFRYSNSAPTVMMSFLISCTALLLFSWITAWWPEIQTSNPDLPGVPVKNRVTQSAVFGISAMCLFYLAVEAWKNRTRAFAIVLSLIALAFIANIAFVATARAELIIIGILVILFCANLWGWKGLCLGIALSAGIGFVVWNASGYLRFRVMSVVAEVQSYRDDGQITSSGLRLELWRKSIEFVAAAPLIGNGTGSAKPLLEKSAVGKSGAAGVVTPNPHNQVLAVAIPLGLVGVAILCVMWFAHLKMFFAPGPTAWIGIVIVVHNILGSLFNSHLFDFTEGWIYAFGVGLMGGIRNRNIESFPKERFYSENFLWPKKA